MSEYIEDLITAIEHIVGDYWHPTTRQGNTGIGKTFEDLLEKEEDNLDTPDFHDIEIKTHETASKSMITLFTKSPSYPRRANTILRENYGKLDEFGNKILHMTVTANRITSSNEYDFNFSIEVDRLNRILKLLVYNKDRELINSDVFWSFDAIDLQLKRKLNYIVIISAKSKVHDGHKYYKYTQADLISGLSLDGILNAIEDGHMKIDIRIGAYKTGRNRGKTHDHGTGFRINMIDLLNYSEMIRIR